MVLARHEEAGLLFQLELVPKSMKTERKLFRLDLIGVELKAEVKILTGAFREEGGTGSMTGTQVELPQTWQALDERRAEIERIWLVLVKILVRLVNFE